MKRKIALTMCMVMCVATVINGCGKAEGGESAKISSQNRTEEDSEGEKDKTVDELSKYLKDNNGCIWYEVNMNTSSNNAQPVVGKDSVVNSIYIFKDGNVACITSTDVTLGEIAKMDNEAIIELAKKQQEVNCESYFDEFDSIDVYSEAQYIVDSILDYEYTLLGDRIFYLKESELELDKSYVEKNEEYLKKELERKFTSDSEYKETLDLWNMGVASDIVDKMIQYSDDSIEELLNAEDDQIHEAAQKCKDSISEEFNEKLEATGYAEKLTQPYTDQIKAYQTGELQYYPYAMCLQTDATGNVVQREYLLFGYFNDNKTSKPYDAFSGGINSSYMEATAEFGEELAITEEDELYASKESLIDPFKNSLNFTQYASFRFDLSSNINSKSYEVYDTNYAGLVNNSKEKPIHLLTKVSANEGFTLDSMETEGVYLDDFDSASALVMGEE